MWDPHTTRNINYLEGVQHRAARFVVHNYSWEVSGSTLASALSWPNPEQRRAEARLSTMYNITNNLLDIDPNQYVPQAWTHPNTDKYPPPTTITNTAYFPRTIAHWNRHQAWTQPNKIQPPIQKIQTPLTTTTNTASFHEK